MNRYRYQQFIQLKRDITEFKELTNYQEYLIQTAPKLHQIEIIELYDELLGRIYDLIEYPKMTEEQKTLLENMSKEQRWELIKIFNQTIKEMNEYIESTIPIKPPK